MSGVDADFHIRSQAHFLRMIALMRELERNDPLVGQGVRRLSANVNVGQMVVQPMTGNDKVDDILRDKWRRRGEDPELCDASGKLGFSDQADLAFERVIVDGDILVVPKPTGQALHLEAHRCLTPTHSKVDRGTCGIKVDRNGRPQTYYITSQAKNPHASILVNDVKPLAAFNSDGWANVFHCYRPQRFSLTRGITSLAPTAASAAKRDDLEFATLLKAQVSACVTFIENFDSNEQAARTLAHRNGTGLGPITATGTDAEDYEPDTVGLEPGRIVRGQLGRKLEMHTPRLPDEGYFKLGESLVRYLALNLDLPAIVLMLDASDTTFSSYRHVLDQARMAYRKIQQWFAACYHRNIYRNAVRLWVQEDKRLAAYVSEEGPASLRQSNIFRHAWNPVGYEYIDPVKDAQRWLIERYSGAISDTRFFGGRGQDAKVELAEVVKNREYSIHLAIEAAQRIEEATGVAVDWQYFAPIASKNGMALQLIDSEQGNDADDKPEKANNA